MRIYLVVDRSDDGDNVCFAGTDEDIARQVLKKEHESSGYWGFDGYLLEWEDGQQIKEIWAKDIFGYAPSPQGPKTIEQIEREEAFKEFDRAFFGLYKRQLEMPSAILGLKSQIKQV